MIHVAGTNGKGSTIAYLRAFLEAAGKRVHVFTSPHLVRFNERIRLAGKLVETRRAQRRRSKRSRRINAGQPITQFEITTSAALKLFADTPADYLLLEVGMGGTFDSTNVIDHPLGVVITPVDIDHQAYLGKAVADIAVNKAGILKRGSQGGVRPPARRGSRGARSARARSSASRPSSRAATTTATGSRGGWSTRTQDGLIDLPPPALAGFHQFENAALAIAAARHFGLPVSEADFAEGLRTVEWPARLAPVKGRLRDMLPAGHELWLDGGHNAHGAAALARALAEMQAARPAPLVLIVGMMNTRSPADFLAPFAGKTRRVLALDIPGEKNAYTRRGRSPPPDATAASMRRRCRRSRTRSRMPRRSPAPAS